MSGDYPQGVPVICMHGLDIRLAHCLRCENHAFDAAQGPPVNVHTAELHFFPGAGRHGPASVLEIAKQAGLTDVLVLGYDANGKLFKSTSIEEPSALLWILERARHWFSENYFKVFDK